MMKNGEIRAASRKAIGKGWFWRILLAGFVLNGIVQLVSYMLNAAYAEMSIATLSGYLQAKIDAMRSGLDCAIPSAAVAGQMAGASLFQIFIIYIFSAIAVFGCAHVALKAVRNDTERWFAGSFGGFSRPLDLTWLLVLVNLKAFLWSLLFIIPGIVAVYRYRLAWYLKTDNCERSASECIAESGRMMKGFKWQAFCLDLSIVVWMVLGAMVFAISTIIASQASSLVVGIPATIVGFCGFWLFVYSVVYLVSARAVMYEELKRQ